MTEVLTTLIDDFLAEQRDISAVDRFSQRHVDTTAPAMERYYVDLMPATAPGPGEQYAFGVDLDSCTGCKSCVAACHSLNGLDNGESFRRVGALHGGSEVAPFYQTVTTACHHCIDPACLVGCPVDAYEKDPISGIVRHLDDQCIGCQYCTLTCPYEVPKYNHRLGIVRKCDMCSDRLVDGEAPACVQACPTNAISITIVNVDERRAYSTTVGSTLVPGAPSSALTVPTTLYTSQRVAMTGRAVDADLFTPSSAHTPLAIMLVLTQVSVGALIAQVASGRNGTVGALFAMVCAVVALGASVLHLGRPQYAWRAVIGLRHSWLSREIVAFGSFAGTGLLYGLLRLFDVLPSGTITWFATPALISGTIGLFCSAKLYVVTGRAVWRLVPTMTRFAATSVVGGIASLLVVELMADSVTRREVGVLVVLLAAATLAKWCVEVHSIRTSIQRGMEFRGRAILLRTDLHRQHELRSVLALGGGVIVPIVVTAAAANAPHVVAVVIGIAAWSLVIMSEILERRLFFASAVAPRMPGVLT